MMSRFRRGGVGRIGEAMGRRHVIAATAAVLLAACSGGGGDDPVADSTVAPTVVTAAPTASPSTVAPDPTPAPTAPPTPEPTTTPPPVTVPPTSAPRDVVAEVTAAALAYDDWYVECLRDPVNCDPSVVAVEGSDLFVNLSTITDQLATAGFYVGPEDPGYVVIESVEPLGDHVAVAVCGWGTMVLYGPPGPDGNPTVQNDTPATVREVWQFVDAAGVWKLRRTDTTEEVPGVNECPPEV
jgi:hypothetical protein